MSNLIVYIVFHKKIAPILTRTCNYSELIRYFGVNQDYEKHVLTGNGKIKPVSEYDNVQLEYTLPYYDASLQKNGFMETSVYIHVYKNQLHLSHEFIGVTQYDMVWSDEVVDRLKSLKKSNDVFAKTKGVIFSDGEWHDLMFPQKFPLDYVIESYNRHFNTEHTKEDLTNRPLTLWQTYFMHRSVFENLASWLSVLVKEVYPWANQPPYQTNWGFIGGLTERAESIFFALQKDLNISEIGLHHSQEIVDALKIPKEHYGSRISPANKYSVKEIRAYSIKGIMKKLRAIKKRVKS